MPPLPIDQRLSFTPSANPIQMQNGAEISLYVIASLHDIGVFEICLDDDQPNICANERQMALAILRGDRAAARALADKLVNWE